MNSMPAGLSAIRNKHGMNSMPAGALSAIRNKRRGDASLLLPGPFLVRIVLWFVVFVLFPLSGTSALLSFQLEVLGRINSPTWACQKSECAASLNLAERVLLRLEAAEKRELDPWLRDDLRIAWITVLWSARGVPEWSLHGDQPPFSAAVWQVLHCAPEQVWPRIVARRREQLGALYEQFWGETSSPRKPVQSAKSVAASGNRLSA
jgi:hypothetical protein